MASRRPGSVVGRGNTADIVEWGRGAVAKVLRPGIPKEWAETEARTTALVHDLGLPTPAVLDTVTVDGRAGIVFQRVDGPSMWESMCAAPQHASSLVDVLVDLQTTITSHPAPPGMTTLLTRLEHDITHASVLSDSERAVLLPAVANLPHGTALCHFDLHPNNVILTGSGPVIVDWFDAGAGDPAADVVRSSVLMQPGTALGHLTEVDETFLARVHDEYLERVRTRISVPESDVPTWEIVVLAARLAEPLPIHVADATYRALLRRLSPVLDPTSVTPGSPWDPAGQSPPLRPLAPRPR